MQVQQMIRASADVLTITHLAPGNVYKRVDGTDYSGEPRLYFGVVQDVMNNGEDSAVTALEYERDYGSGIKATLRVFTGSKPAALFPATPEEVSSHLDDLERAAEKAVTDAETALSKAHTTLGTVAEIRAKVGALSAPATSTTALEA